MNREAMSVLADYLEDKPMNMSKVDFDGYGDDCDTPVCILGWARFRSGLRQSENDQSIHDELGLTVEEGGCLFTPRGWFLCPLEPVIQKQRALAVLRGQIVLDYLWLTNPTWVTSPELPLKLEKVDA